MRPTIPFALFALCAALLAGAQAPPPPPAAPPEAEEAGPPESASRREMLRLTVLSRMRQRLGLSEAQTVRVMAVMEAMELQRERHRQEMAPAHKRLQALVDDPDTSVAAFQEAVAAFEKQREAQQRDNDAREAELLAALTPRQQAQWLLLRRELMGRLAERLDGRPGPRGAGPRAGGPGGPPPVE